MLVYFLIYIITSEKISTFNKIQVSVKSGILHNMNELVSFVLFFFTILRTHFSFFKESSNLRKRAEGNRTKLGSDFR